MDNIEFKVDPDSKKEVDGNTLFRLVPGGSALGKSVVILIDKVKHGVVLFNQFLKGGYVDAHLYILTNTGYHKYVVLTYMQPNNTFHVYKIIEDDNATDNNIQNLDGE